VTPILIGLLIGVGIGSYVLSLVHPSWVKFVTYVMLLPLILLQAAGIRRIGMAFDALIVAFGLSRILIELDLATAFTTYGILTIMMMVNAYLLFRFFRDRTVREGREMKTIPAKNARESCKTSRSDHQLADSSTQQSHPLSSRYKLWTHIVLLVILTPSFFHCLNQTRP